MLSITKINSLDNKRSRGGSASGGYLFYLGSPSTRDKGSFDDYARQSAETGAPAPFWGGSAPVLLDLPLTVAPEAVQRLAEGRHPLTGEPLVQGAGASHVMGADLTFSAPKDVSALFAGGDASTQAAINECMRGAVEAALAYSESVSVTRHGRGGRVKQRAEAVAFACYPHFASRALDPQLHVHAFMFNLGKRAGAGGWSALDQKAQFDHKLATGILFRVELADRLRKLGFAIQRDGPYFKVEGISDFQRDALSQRSKEISAYLAERGLSEKDGAAAREIASLNTRSNKSEPGYSELVARFKDAASVLGLTSSYVAGLRAKSEEREAIVSDRALDIDALISDLTATKSVATSQDALALICEKAMGRWSAARCLRELESFLAHPSVLRLGETEHLSQVFTSRDMRDLEADISARVSTGQPSTTHRVPAALVDEAFEQLEAEIEAKLGAKPDLGQQRRAATHVCSTTGDHAFVEGWAGAGKTTMLRAVGQVYAKSGFKTIGCSQSAAAVQNLARETGIRSNTIASLLLAVESGRLPLGRKTVVILDEAGMVGSRELAALQRKIVNAGAKLVCVGDSKQLQPIAAGGIFKALVERHGAAEISNIQRQRTDVEPLLKWLSGATGKNPPSLPKETIAALRRLPEDALGPALDALATSDERMSYGLQRWRDRFDHLWMRDCVERFAIGRADEALAAMDSRGRIKLISDTESAMEVLISAWDQDKTAVKDKAIIAGARVEVAALNALARQRMIQRGLVDESAEVEVDIERRDGSREPKRFAAGDRIVFTLNDSLLGVANGSLGSITAISRSRATGEPELSVELDDINPNGERLVKIPAAFARFDHAYCLTNHKSQGRTFDSAHVYVNAAMADREWSYVAASRSRFATTLYVNTATLDVVDPESHVEPGEAKDRADLLEALSARMSRARAKGTTLDFDIAHPPESAPPLAPSSLAERLATVATGLRKAARDMSSALARINRPGLAERERERGSGAASTPATTSDPAATSLPRPESQAPERAQERSR